MTRLTQAYLALAGLTALFVGLGMLSMPAAFYSSYGIDPTLSPSLASELRSPGVLLTIIGLLFLAYGIISPQWRNFALWGAALFYLAYATGRSLSLAIDGIPSNSLLTAGTFELLLGLAAAALLLARRRTIAA